jgi:phosphoserine phosphatase RsbU/P
MRAEGRPVRGIVGASPPAILVVDDNEDNRLVVEGRLNALGFTDVSMAQSGEQALQLVRARRFHLVLLDVMMPGIDGMRVLEVMRDEGHTAVTSVIMLSASDEMSRVIRCIELGAEDYLVKPLNSTLFAARVRATLEKKALNDFAREQLRQLEDQLATARELQLGMLPDALDSATEPITVHAVLEPALQVGGDLCDFFRDGAGGLWFAVGDVSGKGAAAALFMARTWSLLRTILGHGATRPGRQAPGDVMTRVNDALCVANAGSMFATLLIGRLEEATGVLSYANAGHQHPYLLGGQGVRVLSGAVPQLPAGAWPGTAYETQREKLAPGEAVFVYSDGLTEAENANHMQYGEDRLRRDLEELRSLPGGRLVAEILRRVRTHCGERAQSDDIAALVARRRLSNA